MTSNFTLVDGLGLELRIFNLTHQKRSKAKVDLRGYVTNMSNLRSMLKGSGTQQPQKAFLQIMKYPPGVAEHAHPDGFPRAPLLLLVTLASDLIRQVRLNILKYHPKPTTSM